MTRETVTLWAVFFALPLGYLCAGLLWYGVILPILDRYFGDAQ